jgi:hypothetical protein
MNIKERNLITHVYYSSIIPNSQAMASGRCSTTNEWIKDMFYIYIKGVLFSHKEE